MKRLFSMLVLFVIALILTSCGGGGGGSNSTPGNFSGTWSGTYNGTYFEYSVTQTGSNFTITRATPYIAGLSYNGIINGNSAVVSDYINNVHVGTSTWTLLNNSTTRVVVSGCTPPQGYSCAPSGTTVNLNRADLTTLTGSMVHRRGGHTATLLANGNVLVIGGEGDMAASPEYYNLANGLFSSYEVLSAGRARQFHTATLLVDGSVLVVGGSELVDSAGSMYRVFSGAGLYSASTTYSYSTLGAIGGREYHTATLLENGKVLIVGGMDGYTGGGVGGNSRRASAEIYDPVTRNFTFAGSMADGRSSHTATHLTNGKVLIAGGYVGTLGIRAASAELYDPATGVFTVTGSMVSTRVTHTATLLLNGKVLFTGGTGYGSAELYDPVTGLFTVTGSMLSERKQHTATLLPNGKVLVIGGSNGTYLASAEYYDPASGSFSYAGGMASARSVHTATLLPNGKVLVIGGVSGGLAGSRASAELFE